MGWQETVSPFLILEHLDRHSLKRKTARKPSGSFVPLALDLLSFGRVLLHRVEADHIAFGILAERDKAKVTD